VRAALPPWHGADVLAAGRPPVAARARRHPNQKFPRSLAYRAESEVRRGGSFPPVRASEVVAKVRAVAHLVSGGASSRSTMKVANRANARSAHIMT